MSGGKKATSGKLQRELEELLRLPGNDACADCKNKSPRWASHNLGIFICMRCAGIHRKLGTHISKVKSLSFDSWAKDEVESMRKMGNTKSNQIYNPDVRRNPLPDNLEESERDSEMEKFIRSKYQFGRFKSKASIVESYLGPSQSKTTLPPRSQTAPIRSGSSPRPRSAASNATPPLPPARQHLTPNVDTTTTAAPSATLSTAPHPRASSISVSSALPPTLSSPHRNATMPFSSSFSSNPIVQPSQPSIRPDQQASLSSSTFNDLISIQAAPAAPSLPLQYQNTSFSTNPYASLSPGGFPSIAADRSPALRSASLPVSTPSAFGLSPPMNGMANSSTFNPFFQQQQPQQVASQQFNAVAGPSPFNPFSQPFQPQPDFSQTPGIGGVSPVSPQPQLFSSPTNGFQAPQSTTPFGMTPPINGVQPYQQTPSPSFSMLQQQHQQPMSSPPPPQMSWQQPQSGPQLSQRAQQAQQLFQSMAAGNDGSGRNPFAFS